MRSTSSRRSSAPGFQICKDKGFDAIEADNVDGYTNKTGFPLKAADQLRFNRFIAAEAHALDLAIALKNDTDQVKQLEPSFDLAVVEQCFEFDECEAYRPFVKKNKAVLIAEYDPRSDKICERARRLRMSVIFKRLDLGAKRRTC